jgi:hypothetical protein
MYRHLIWLGSFERYLEINQHFVGYLTRSAFPEIPLTFPACQSIDKELRERFHRKVDWRYINTFYAADNGVLIDLTNPINSVF